MGKSIYSGNNENNDEGRQNPSMTSFAELLIQFATLPQVVSQPVEAGRETQVEAATFNHAVIALAAKLAAVDGTPNTAEYGAFHALFVANSSMDSAQARSLFVQRAGDSSSAQQYARALAVMTSGDHALHGDLLKRLLQVATADGMVNAAELDLLRMVAESLGLPEAKIRAAITRSLSSAASPYEVLGVSAKVTDKELRAHYMARVSQLHPDKAAGASKETIAMLSDQLAALNAAYQAIQVLRTKNTAAPTKSWFGRQKH